MKHVHYYAFIFCLVLAINKSEAQSTRIFAVTAKDKGCTRWSCIREIDVNNSTSKRSIYSSEGALHACDALTRQEFEQRNDEIALRDSTAAIAYDKKCNRLYFTPMHCTDLRYIDLSTSSPKLYVVRHQQLKQFVSKPGQEDVITRMTFASDGNGYALTNNGNHLIRFATGDKIIIQDLGSLKDGKNNRNNSIHSYPQNWGGDMVADAFGKLYLITQTGNVYQIDPLILVSDFLGTIKNIPADFTINGAAVDADNNIVISSAVKTNEYYRFDLSSFEAIPVSKSETNVYNASDLSSANLLNESNATKKDLMPEGKVNMQISAYPNPVINGSFSISFNKIPNSNYLIELIDVRGSRIFNKTLNAASGQREKIYLPANINSGTFILRVINMKEKNKIYTDKILVAK
jgi:outer membrane protein assembly factor BamB